MYRPNTMVLLQIRSCAVTLTYSIVYGAVISTRSLAALTDNLYKKPIWFSSLIYQRPVVSRVPVKTRVNIGSRPTRFAIIAIHTSIIT